MRKKRESAQVFRITGAAQGLADDVRGRQRRYVISMSVRTVSVLLTVLLWNVERPVAIGCLVLGVLLPYVAVVIANAGRENAISLPRTHVAPVRPMLTAAPAAPAYTDPGAQGRPRGPEMPGSTVPGTAGEQL